MLWCQHIGRLSFSFLLKPTEQPSPVYPKKVPGDMFHPPDVLMWHFNDLLSLRRFSISGGNDTPDEMDTVWNSCPQQYQQWKMREDSMTEQPSSVAFSHATYRFCCWAFESSFGSVLLVEGTLIVAITWAPFCDKLGGKFPTHNMEFYLHNSSTSSLGLPCVFHAS